MPLTASGVALPPDLSSVFGGIGTGTYNQIGQNYGGALSKATGDASAQGFSGGPTDYTKQRLNTTQGLDIGNLATGLGNSLGNTSYNNALQQRDFTQNEALARQVASLNRPDLLQQIMMGVGAVGKPLATYAGMGGFSGGGGGGGGGLGYGGGGGSMPPGLSLYPGGGASQYYGGGY
jgi:hypothetical protein